MRMPVACAKCGVPMPSPMREYARAEVRAFWRLRDVQESRRLVSLTLCRACAFDLAAVVAEWAEVSA